MTMRLYEFAKLDTENSTSINTDSPTPTTLTRLIALIHHDIVVLVHVIGEKSPRHELFLAFLAAMTH